jgi:hypothetical protein
MKPDEIVYEWIDRYLNGELKGNELSDFTNKLTSDGDFSALVQNQKAANDIILGNRLSAVKQMMDENFKSTDTKNNTATKWGLGGLLGVSVLISGILYFSDNTVIPISSFSSTTVSNNIVETQKQSSNILASKPDEKLHEEVFHPLYEKINKPSSADRTLLLDVQKSSDNATNTTTERINQSIHPTSVDTIQIKNQVLTTPINIQKHDLCLGVVIEAILTVDAACTNKTDGEIHIIENSIKGGQSPYTYILINKSHDTMRQKTTDFVSLSAGQHTLFFKDANNCFSTYKKPLYVNEKSCKQEAQSFSPSAGEHFNYPESDNSDAQITIYNRGGQTVYKTNLSKGISQFWDGTNRNGQLLPTGMYIYIIEYFSGNRETGEVVIY